MLLILGSWLSDHSELLTALLALVGTFGGSLAAWRASWKGIADLRKAEAEEWKRKYEEKNSESVVLSRDYHQTLEFNLQDRDTIERLADEIVRLCVIAKEDAARILFRVRMEVRSGATKRRLLEGVHATTDPEAD
ncbi:MAG TPA: hypothetical protein VIP46_02670 [Pyrinomonadaceae bacterium]